MSPADSRWSKMIPDDWPRWSQLILTNPIWGLSFESFLFLYKWGCIKWIKNKYFEYPEDPEYFKCSKHPEYWRYSEHSDCSEFPEQPKHIQDSVDPECSKYYEFFQYSKYSEYIAYFGNSAHFKHSESTEQSKHSDIQSNLSIVWGKYDKSIWQWLKLFGHAPRPKPTKLVVPFCSHS